VETIEVTVNTQGNFPLGASGILMWVRNLRLGCENAVSRAHTRIQARAK
jgi:hypothetical protein